MPCATCNHTMQCLSERERIHWCPRCGTVKLALTDITDTPMLVQRCRKYWDDEVSIGDGSAIGWIRLGIAESINLPENRPS